jgi:glycosyltransferase involved in cell wall biosynthesis
MISIIVPIYKAEKYIHRCIDSILAQSYTDFELLLIDDGSPDNCGAICDEYAAKDSRVRVLHKENGGVSSARNLGLDNAQGEWITFIDSDDWVESEFLDKLIEGGNADLIVGGCYRTSGMKQHLEDRLYDMKSIPEFLDLYLDKLLLRTPWGKLFKRSIIEDNHIRFKKDIRFGEDTLVVYEYLCHCSCIASVSYCGYNYLDETDGWVLNSRKYKLSLSEIDASLGRTIALIHRLNERFSTTLDVSSFIFIYLSMYSTFNFSDDSAIVAYKGVCQKYMPHLDDVSFYSNRLYSPVMRGIIELKNFYAEGLYAEGKALYPILYRISQVAPRKISFVYKDFYLWYILIRSKAFFLCDKLLRAYLSLK